MPRLDALSRHRGNPSFWQGAPAPARLYSSSGTQLPFALSLSEAKLKHSFNGCLSFGAVGQKKVRCFDKLSTNG
jgi:hypothetical protein